MSKVKDERNVQQDILKIMDALGLETKANEAMSSAQAGFGDEWVPTEMADSIIENARAEEGLFSLIPSSQNIDMPTNPYDLPVESTDPTWYNTAEEPDVTGTDVTTSKVATAKITLSAAKFSASVYLSGELDEDAKVAGGIRAHVEQKLGLAYAELIDKAIINGDTETGATGNVNSDDGAPTAGTYYLGFDGLTKHAFAGTSMTDDVGTLAAADFMTVRQNLAARYSTNPSKLLVVMNPETYYKTLQLAQVETAEKFSAATIENGVLKSIYGMRIHVAPDFGLAEADGKQSTTGANNTLGRFMIVYLPALVVGWRRKMKINLEYLPRVDQYVLTAHSRFTADMVRDDMVSLGYNVTV